MGGTVISYPEEVLKGISSVRSTHRLSSVFPTLPGNPLWVPGFAVSKAPYPTAINAAPNSNSSTLGSTETMQSS
jgi:hypothetical protein